METPSTDDLCAVWAVVRSLRSQIGLQIPDTDARAIIESDEFQERLQPFQFSLPPGIADEDVQNLRPGVSQEDSIASTSNLPIDQAALLLEMIGRQQGLNLQLGIITPGFTSVIYPRDGAVTIWVYNNNVQAALPGLMNHYEAVELLVPTPEYDAFSRSV